jgi:hypothetical protein
MRRVVLFAALAATSLFAVSGVALAGGHEPPVTEPPTAVTLPAPAPVVDTDTAAAFTKIYVARNAARFLGQDRRRVRVLDVASACLQSPILATRFGCVFTLRASVLVRSSWDNWGRSARVHSTRGGHHPQPRHIRARNFGCLGELTIDGGPSVTPTAQVRFLQCARIPRDDITVVAPTDDSSY